MKNETPPHDNWAEEAVIASALVDTEALTEMLPILEPEDFHRDENRWAWESIRAITERDGVEAVSIITLCHDLALRNRLVEIGGPARFTGLTAALATSKGARYYAATVKSTSTLRKLISACETVKRRAYESVSVEDTLTEAMALVQSVADAGLSFDIPHLKDGLHAFTELPPVHTTGVMSRWADINQLLGSFRNGSLYVIAATTGKGKTSMLVDLLSAAVLKGKKKALLFSLEMGLGEITNKFIANASGVDSFRIECFRHALNESEQRRVNQALGELGDVAQWIDDRAAPTIEDIAMRAKAHKLRHGCDIIGVDYLQLASVREFRGKNRTQVVTEISRGLKNLAKECGIPVIALSQLSRAAESTVDQRPELKHLRESGSIEQDADVVLFIHPLAGNLTREQWDREHRDDLRHREYPEGINVVIVAKNRHGPTGDIHLKFNKKVSRFEDLFGGESEWTDE